VHINVEELVKDISALASLPEIYLQIRNLIDDPSSELDDFAVVVNTDPGLASSVLKIVNSAFFNFPGQIGDISKALNLIGIAQLHDLVLGVSAINALEHPNDIESLKTFWRRSIFCGSLARLLAKSTRLQDADSLFVIGLLHEIGHLVLFAKLPTQSRQIIQQAQDQQCSLSEIEQIQLNTNYGRIGQSLMEEWNLPYKFQYVTGNHCELNDNLEYSIETTIIHLSHQLAVNKHPGADSFYYPLKQSLLDTFSIDEKEMDIIYKQASDISAEMEKVLFKTKA